MNIVFVISSLNRGGAEKILTIMANHYVERGHCVCIVTWDHARTPPAYPLDPCVSIVPLDLSFRSTTLIEAVRHTFYRWLHLRHALHACMPGRVISFMDQTNVLTLMASCWLRIPVFVMERTDPWAWPPETIWRFLRLCIYPLADRVVVQTEAAKKYFPFWLQRKIECLPNPVLAPDNEPRPSLTEHQVIAVGRLDTAKRFDLLVNAMALLRVKYPDWKLVIIGEGPRRPILERAARENPSITFIGDTSNLSPHWSNASVFALPSDFEGFPNALCEAMACGLAVVATATIGSKAIVRDGIDGMLVPVGDLAALTSALDCLMGDVSLRERLGQRARDVTERFSIHQIRTRWDQMLVC